jgi:hypothetical protein
MTITATLENAPDQIKDDRRARFHRLARRLTDRLRPSDIDDIDQCGALCAGARGGPSQTWRSRRQLRAGR